MIPWHDMKSVQSSFAFDNVIIFPSPFQFIPVKDKQGGTLTLDCLVISGGHVQFKLIPYLFKTYIHKYQIIQKPH